MRLSGAFVPLRGMKGPARRLLLVVLVLALIPPVSGATAAAPQASLADLEDEVMCPICGTLLELSNSPQAERQRAFVERQIAAGRTKAEIKDALVTQYGDRVLAQPDGSGFDLSAYLVPVLAFATAIVALGIGVGRWRRAGARGGGIPQATRGDGDPHDPRAPRGEDAERLDADLARYDL
jgi:cytochrome c-type biogenesis protein CcmH